MNKLRVDTSSTFRLDAVVYIGTNVESRIVYD